ncbi:gamma-secretase subunit Aph-1 [Frankliniella occidentalis]|uniref:Gamma-secretase subunit Aph-1 n=1 Tax=Frankliniella occidentalis TaxID=133901 RepID=A0A6J1SNV2_FRAOC|nr:gamma-secretase subunit Aph-1 [Frankliniella occidentalis]
MTLCEFFGCAFMAFGPAIAMFILTIAQDPISIIIVFASGFFWLLSALLSSIIWLFFGLSSMSPQVQLALSVIFSVHCQEVFRFLLYLTLTSLDDGLKNMIESSTPIINRKMLGYSAGIGFGVMSGVFAIINVLADAVGPATMGLKAGSESFFLISSCSTLCFVLLHVFWSVIFFAALDQYRANKIQLLFVLVTHLLASSLTLLNSGGPFAASLVPNYLIVILTACVAFHAAGGSISSLKSSLTRQ